MKKILMIGMLFMALGLTACGEDKEESLYQAVEEFAYVTYNHVRPYSYNGYKTPMECRCA